MTRTYPRINRREGGTFSKDEARSSGRRRPDATSGRQGRATQPQSEEMSSLPMRNFRIGSNNIRCFIAIDLPLEITENFYKTILSFKTSVEGLRPTPPENIHLTLKFLSYIPDEMLKKIKNAIDETVKCVGRFDMTFGGIGMFPNFSSPRILWLAPEKGLEQIGQIKERLDNFLSAAGVEKDEKDFKAHITLARIKYIKKEKTDFKKIFSTLKFDTKSVITVDALHLYQSKLTANGALYTKLYSASMAVGY